MPLHGDTSANEPRLFNQTWLDLLDLAHFNLIQKSVCSQAADRRPIQMQIKKLDSSTFKGDIFHFPVFVMKWKAQVGMANFHVESEQLSSVPQHVTC